MTQTQLSELFNDLNTTDKKWELESSNTKINEVNDCIIKYNYNEGFKKNRITENYINSITALSKLGLVNGDYLTNAGNLLFSSKGPIWLKMGVFATEQKITILDMVQIHGNIFECIEESYKFICKNIGCAAEINSTRRVDMSEIPVNAIREIIVNSFAHASYHTSSTYHEIDIFPTKITIYNPGKLPRGIEPITFSKNNFPCSFRNPKISEILFRCSQIEAFGTGFKRAFSLFDDAKIKYDYADNHEGFSFNIYRKEILYGSDTTKVPPVDELNNTEIEVLEILKKNPHYKNIEMSELIFKSEKTVYRCLNILQKYNYIKKAGTQKNIYWEILK
ncbi:MAG: winged helix-turn-helix transcriptional regulator [Acholeplasmatales bacterium]|nr:winged helix-turn-helix transcriptional regulator [Acholeplasmatales bacterium]